MSTSEILDVELLQTVKSSSELKQSFLGFLNNCRSPLTRIEYEKTVRNFLMFLSPQIRQLSELKRAHIIDFKTHLLERGLANKTVLKHLSAVSAMVKHLAVDGLVDKDLFYGVKRPTDANAKEWAHFSEEEVKKIFAALDPGRYNYFQYRAILAVGFYTGLRSANIRNLRIGDIVEEKGHKIVVVRVKGDKNHEVALNQKVTRFIDEHLARLVELGFQLDGDHYLFPSLKPKKNKPLCAESLRYILRSTVSKAQIQVSEKRRCSPHSMRFTVTSHLLGKGVALEKVQRYLGHSNPATTQKYDLSQKTHDGSPAYWIDY